MSFGKAKIQRFNDIKPCAPSPAAYNVATKEAVKNSQSERATEPRSPPVSETGSTHSVPCRFRTPTTWLPKKKKPTTSILKSKPLFTENIHSEALKEKIVECKNKDASIKSLREEIEELKDKLGSLDNQRIKLDLEKRKMDEYVKNLGTEHENQIKKMEKKFKADIKKITEEKAKISEEVVLIQKQYDELKEANKKEMMELKSNCDKFHVLYDKSVEECKKIVEEKNKLLELKKEELKALEENCSEIQKKHSMEIEKLVREHQREIQDIEFEILKAMTELQREKEQASNKITEIDSLMKKTIADLKKQFAEERQRLLLEYEDRLNQNVEQVRETEKLHMKEMLAKLENNWKSKLEEQQQQSDAILKECQTISEYNIIQCELEKKEFETQLMEKTKELEANIILYNEIMKNYDELKAKYSDLCELAGSNEELKNSNESLTKTLCEKTSELQKYLEENRTYIFTIKNFQNTIEVLKQRLISSDRDVEQLKREVSDNESRLLEYENKCIQLTSDLKEALDYNEELEMQHESAIKLNTREIQHIKSELLQKVESYREEVEALSKKLRENEDVKQEVMQQLRQAFKIIEKLKSDFDYYNTMSCEYEFEMEQSRTELEDYRIREMDWNNLKEKLEHNVRQLENLLETKQDEIGDVKHQMVLLQEKYGSCLQDLEFYKTKVEEYEKELEEIGNIHKKYIEQSGKYDELLQKFEQLERKNLENEKVVSELSAKCRENDSYVVKYNEQKRAYDALVAKCEQMEEQMITWNMEKADEDSLKVRLEKCEQERDNLQGRIQYLQEELKEVTDKYTDLAGHHNNKQKIKHVVDLKAKNEELIQSNMNLELKMRSQLKAMEKLKKENADLKKCVRKTRLHPEDKENIGSPSRSLNSSRVESPLRDRN